jgi:hypothetical protein
MAGAAGPAPTGAQAPQMAGAAMPGMKKGGKTMKKMANGGMDKDATIEAGEKHLPHGEHATQKRGHTRAKNLGDSGKVLPSKNMAKGGMASSRGDGIAQRGKTRGKYC